MLLSILIPAYNYPAGVERILNSLRGICRFPVELILFDDSSDNQIERLVFSFRELDTAHITYRHNLPALGAVANWNALLDEARGEFVLLLHHDEFPFDDGFIESVLKLLECDCDADVLVADCLLCDRDQTFIVPHLPRWLRAFVIHRFPAYIFRRNVIGPTSCLIIRRDLYPRFDDRLRWLVDVEAYFRLRKLTARWRFCGNLRIGSVQGRKDSITSSIKDELELLDTSERAYLFHSYPVAEVWLAPRCHRSVNILEGFAWGAMRVVTRVWYRFAYFSRLTSPFTPYLQHTTTNDHQ